MTKRGFIVVALLLIASLMAAMGTGAIDVFTAKRSAAMTVVTDTEGLISLKPDGFYAHEDTRGRLYLDFKSTYGGLGVNAQAYSEFHDVFTVTNQSEKKVFVWFETANWYDRHDAILQYRIGNTSDGTVVHEGTYYTNPDYTIRNMNLIDKSSQPTVNYVNGEGRAAYVELAPGESFTVKVIANTVTDNSYGDANTVYSNLEHSVIVKARTTQPNQLPKP